MNCSPPRGRDGAWSSLNKVFAKNVGVILLCAAVASESGDICVVCAVDGDLL